VLNLKIFHLADTHLGFSAYTKLDPEAGLNQREVDINNAFKKFVDAAIDEKPDLILHAGDFFDSVRPTNRAISFAMDQLLRLSEADLPIVVIAGNHETPRLRETGSVFRLFEHLKNVYPIYKSKYECISFPELELKIHVIPHCNSPEALREALEQLKPDNEIKYNIAMLHAAIIGVAAFRGNEFNEQEIQSGYLKPGFDYIALGHYHEFCKVDENAYYSGSTERMNFLEAGHENKGFVEINFSDEAVYENSSEIFQNYPTPTFHPLPTRPMLDLKPIDCSTHDRSGIADKISTSIQSVDPENKILRLKVQNIPMEVYKTLDFNQFRKLTADALYFEIKYEVTKDEGGSQTTELKFDILGNEFKTFIANEPVEGLDKEKLSELALEYLSIS
jgi:DNA repair exonuclease SbcCD nuclease subunit